MSSLLAGQSGNRLVIENPSNRQMQNLSQRQETFSTWLKLAKKHESGKSPNPVAVKYCLQQAYFNSTDLAESFFNYSCDIIGRSKDGLTRDKRAQYFEFLTRPGRFKMVQAARGSWKSSICVCDYSSWCIGRDYIINGNSSERILLASEVQELARRNARWVLLNMRTKPYIYLAGDHKDSGKQGALPWGVWEMMSRYRSDPLLGDPTLMPMGSSSERTGFHFDKVICDDLEAQRSSATRDMIENIWDFYRLLHSILDPNGQMIIVCTRWHEDDIYRRIEDENEFVADDEKFDILILPACDEEFKNLNFPNVLDEKKLRSIKRKQGTYIYSCQYLLKPTPDEMRIFKSEWIKIWTPQMLNQYRLNVYTTADFAWTEVKKMDFRRGNPRSDYTVILTVAIDEAWNYIILDWFRDKCLPHAGITELYRQWKQHKAKLSIVQKYDVRGVGESIEQLGYELNEQMPVDYVAYGPDQGKAARITEMVQPRFEDLKVYLHPTMLEWFAKDELLDFPKAKHDDALDALCNVVKFGKPPPRTRMISKLTKEQREIEMLKAGIDPTAKDDEWMNF